MKIYNSLTRKKEDLIPLKKGHIVTGPKKPVIPPEPNWKKFKDGWEVMGVGTVFTNRERALDWRRRHGEYLQLYRQQHKNDHRVYMREYMRLWRKKRREFGPNA